MILFKKGKERKKFQNVEIPQIWIDKSRYFKFQENLNLKPSVFNYYSSNGWLIVVTEMKDWKLRKKETGC
jgi:hypothetical protein